MHNALFETSLSAKLLKNNITSHFSWEMTRFHQRRKQEDRNPTGNNQEPKTNFSPYFLHLLYNNLSRSQCSSTNEMNEFSYCSLFLILLNDHSVTFRSSTHCSLHTGSLLYIYFFLIVSKSMDLFALSPPSSLRIPPPPRVTKHVPLD